MRTSGGSDPFRVVEGCAAPRLASRTECSPLGVGASRAISSRATLRLVEGCAEIGEEGIFCDLRAERRRRSVSRVDDRLRRKAFHQGANRLEQRVPVAARDVGPPHAAGEEHVAGEGLPST